MFAGIVSYKREIIGIIVLLLHMIYPLNWQGSALGISTQGTTPAVKKVITSYEGQTTTRPQPKPTFVVQESVSTLATQQIVVHLQFNSFKQKKIRNSRIRAMSVENNKGGRG
jgi:hypothetical protein